MKHHPHIFALVLAFIGFGCAEKKKPDYETSIVLKIVIHADGSILVDGARTNLPEVPAKLVSLTERKGVVWFSRANPEGEPPPNSMEVLKMIMDARRPIQLFTKEDFSETVGPDGKPQKVK